MSDIIVETEASIEQITEALNDAGIECFIYVAPPHVVEFLDNLREDERDYEINGGSK